MNNITYPEVGSFVRRTYGYERNLVGEVVGHNYVHKFVTVYFYETDETHDIHPLGLEPVE